MKFLKKKLALAMALVMLLSVVFNACTPIDPGGLDTDKVVASIAFKEGTVVTTYVQGATPDFSNVKVTLTYTDDTTADIGIDDENLALNTSAIVTTAVGTRKLRATYTDPANGIKHNAAEVEITITHNPAKFVDSISFKAGTLVTSYTEGATLNTSGVKLIATLADESELELSSGFTLTTSSIDMNTPGTYPLYATYVDIPNNSNILTCNINITVNSAVVVDPDKFVSSIKFVAGTYTSEFLVGTTAPSFSGVKIELTHADGTKSEKDSGFLVSNTVDITTAGNYTLTATYVDILNGNAPHTCTAVIVVKNPAPVNEYDVATLIGFKAGTFKSSYEIGEYFPYQSIKILATVPDGESTKQVEVTYPHFDLNLEDFIDDSGVIVGSTGPRTLKATLQTNEGELEATVSISITQYVAPSDDEIVASIEFYTGSFQTEYDLGSTIDLSQIAIIINYLDGSSSEPQYNIFEFNDGGLDNGTANVYTIIATYVDPNNGYQAHTVSATITVVAPAPQADYAGATSISFKAATVKAAYYKGEYFAYTSIKLEAQMPAQDPDPASVVEVRYPEFELTISYDDNGTTKTLALDEFVDENDLIDVDEGEYLLEASLDVGATGESTIKTTSIIINVSNAPAPKDEDLFVDRIEFVENTITTEYTVGDIPSFSGVEIKKILRSGDESTMTSGFILDTSELNTTTVGKYNVHAIYIDQYNNNNEIRCSIEIEVKKFIPAYKYASVIAFKASTIKQSYEIGELFPYTGIVVTPTVMLQGAPMDIGYSLLKSLKMYKSSEDASNAKPIAEYLDVNNKFDCDAGDYILIATLTVVTSLEDDTDMDIVATHTITIVNPNYVDESLFIQSVALQSGTYMTTYTEGDVLVRSSIIMEITNAVPSTQTIAYPNFSVVIYARGDDETSLFSSGNAQATVNLSEVGDYDLVATYYDALQNHFVSVTIAITVVPQPIIPEDHEFIYGYATPQYLEDFSYNTSDKTNDEEEFYVRTNSYEVGYNNTYTFFPEITRYNAQGLPYVMSGTGEEVFESEVVIYEIESGASVTAATNTIANNLLNNKNIPQDWENVTNTASIVTFNASNGEFSFTSAANDRTFVVAQRIKERAYAKFESIANAVVWHQFKVVNGFNVHNAKQLSVLDNSEQFSSNGAAQNRWEAYKNAHGIPFGSAAASISRVILHSNISITAADLPASYFWTASELNDASISSEHIGTLKDNLNIYARSTSEGSTFTLSGNYFTIDASKIPLITYDSGRTNPAFVTSNANLIGMGGGEQGIPATYDEGGSGVASGFFHGTNIIKNTAFLGNAPRSDNPANCGGFKLVEGSGITHLNNVIARNFFGLALPNGAPDQRLGHVANERVAEEFRLTHVKSYDTFSAMFYLWNHSNVIAENSEFKRSGGPIFVLTDSEEGLSTEPSATMIDCIAETSLAGDEIWFQIGYATPLATNLKSLNSLFVGLTAIANAHSANMPTRTMLKESMVGGAIREYANILCIIMTTTIDASAISGIRQGNFTIKKTISGSLQTVASMDTTNEDWMNTPNLAIGLHEKGAPVFASSGGGLAVYVDSPSDALFLSSASVPFHLATEDPGAFMAAFNANNLLTPTNYSAYSTDINALLSGDYMSVFNRVSNDTTAGTSTMGIMVEYF